MTIHTHLLCRGILEAAVGPRVDIWPKSLSNVFETFEPVGGLIGVTLLAC